MVSISDRLREERERLGHNQTAFASVAKRDRKSQTRYESGDRSPDADYLAAISGIGADVLYILTGRKDLTLHGEWTMNDIRNRELGDIVRQQAAQIKKEALEMAITSEDSYARIPAYPVEASAGDGATAVDVAPDGALAFRKDWLSKHGISLDNATLLRARGDSMEPIIWDGDLLLIDRSRTTINASAKKTRQKAVYVVELEGQLLVKTLRRPSEDRIILISENVAGYDPTELRGRELNALRIVGKVVWWGHTAG